MSDRLPLYLLAQRREIPIDSPQACTCLTDVPGAPVGAYVADPTCAECDGVGVLIEPELSAEAMAFGCTSLPDDHPALVTESYMPTRPGSRSR